MSPSTIFYQVVAGENKFKIESFNNDDERCDNPLHCAYMPPTITIEAQINSVAIASTTL
jgi:hypothetical protein